MAERFTIAEISRLTGLAAHTLRYYEQQFPVLLGVERTRGGHRVYRKQHLETISNILQLLKEEKVSIRKAKELLGEPETNVVVDRQGVETPVASKEESGSADVGKLLMMIVDRLDTICRNNDGRDRMLESFLRRQTAEGNDELLEQISRCRYETRETMKLCQMVMQQRSKAN